MSVDLSSRWINDGSNLHTSLPPDSYLYSSEKRESYLFLDPNMDKFSFLPAIVINGKKIIFTIQRQYAVYCDDTFFISLPQLLKKIRIPEKLDQELLEKIAIVANYLAQGEEYTYVPGTAEEKEQTIRFSVQKGNYYCRVTIPSLKSEEINYEEEMASQT